MRDQTTPRVRGGNDEAKDDDDINSVLPDDILEEILAKLPITSIARVGAICNKWKHITMSETFISRFRDPESQRCSYLMFTAHRSRREYKSSAYDPALGNWRVLEVPFHIKRDWTVSASSGLVCFLPWLVQSHFVYVYNPITNLCKKIKNPRKGAQRNPIGVSISASETSRSYILAVINLKYHQKLSLSTLAIDVYSSEKKTWETHDGFRIPSWICAVESSAICDGVLYLLCRSGIYPRFFGVVACDLGYDHSFYPISLPNSFRSGRLLNVRGEVVMVAVPRFGEIRIFVLKNKEWVQVATGAYDGHVDAPNSKVGSQFFSSGYGKKICIWNRGKKDNLMFDVETGEWSSVRNVFGVEKRFNAVCFEPRFDIAP